MLIMPAKAPQFHRRLIEALCRRKQNENADFLETRLFPNANPNHDAENPI